MDPQAATPRITAISFDSESAEFITLKTPDEADSLRSRRCVLWIDVEGLGDAKTIHQLGHIFSLHALALEDVVNTHQQVKVEDYSDYLFVVGRRAGETENAATAQVSMFLGRDFLLTFHECPADCLQPLRSRINNPNSSVRHHGADFLAYSVLDALLDEYYPFLETYGQQLDELEDAISDDPSRQLIGDIHQIRRRLRACRRVTWSYRDAISKLLHDPNPLIKDETRTFLRDCFDHTLQLIDLLEIYHEACTDLREVYLSSVSNRLNEIMTVLTIIATIFIPLGFIASVYGMNFNTGVSPWNMPELNWYFGYPFSILLMSGVALGLLVFFYIRGWIRRNPKNG